MGGARDPLSVPAKITFAGDWHMNDRWALRAVLHARDQGADVIVQLGDFGYHYYQRFLRPLSCVLEAVNLHLLFVDGNHEDHRKLAEMPCRPDGLRVVAPNIWHLPRGFRWEWDGVRFLALGGAHSVDQQARRAFGDLWQPEETITVEQARHAVDGGPADVMVTHDCPTGVVIPGIDDRPGPAPFPAVEIARSEEHRKLLRSVVDEVRPASLWHGHYHIPYAQTVDVGWPMHVVGLDMDDTSLRTNTATVTLDQLRPGAVANVAELANLAPAGELPR